MLVQVKLGYDKLGCGNLMLGVCKNVLKKTQSDQQIGLGQIMLDQGKTGSVKLG